MEAPFGIPQKTFDDMSVAMYENAQADAFAHGEKPPAYGTLATQAAIIASCLTPFDQKTLPVRIGYEYVFIDDPRHPHHRLKLTRRDVYKRAKRAAAVLGQYADLPKEAR